METQFISTGLLFLSLFPIVYLTFTCGKIKQFRQEPTGFQLYTMLRFRWQILGSSFLLWAAGTAVSHMNAAAPPWLDYLSGVLVIALIAVAVYMTTCNSFPAVREAQFLSSEDIQTQLSPDDPVIGLELNGEARAYPIKWINQPQIVEDTVGGTPVVVTYSVPSKQAVAFSTDFESDSLRLIFPSRQEHSIMLYDAKSKRLIQQNSGQIIFGQNKGKTLPAVPVRIIPWVTWETIHPDSKVFYFQEEKESVAPPADSPAAHFNAFVVSI